MRRAIAITCIVCASAWVMHADAAEQLQQLQTDDLQLVWFHPAEDYLAPHVARSFENSMAFQKKLWGWTPDGKVNLLLKDFGDYGNAGARSAPNNALIVDIAPFSFSFETFVASERVFSLMNHELVHVANMDQWTKTDMRWRRLLGGKIQVVPKHPETLAYHYLTVPRTVVPRWYLEGVAVFFETWMAGGRGRAQGAYDEMVFRAMVRDHARFYNPAGLAAEGTKVDFQVGVNNYLYGTRFISYLALKYSPERIVDWAGRHEGSKRYYADQFEQVFGKSMEAAWADWITWEQGFQQANLAEIAKYPISKLQPLSHKGLGSISRAFYDSKRNAMIAGFRYPGVNAYVGVMSLADGTIKPLVDVKGPMLYRVTALAYDPDSRTAFYTTDNNSGYRDVMSLDTVTGKTQMLLKDARIGDLVFNHSDRSLWGIRHLNGIVTMVQMPYPYNTYHQVYSWPYGEIAYDIDISPDGTLLSLSHTAVNGDQALHVIPMETLLAGEATPTATFDFGTAVPEGFVFGPDGKSLFGSSYYTGVSNIYRYDIASKKIEGLSNAQTGFFRPLPLPDGRLLAFDYTGQGLLPGFIDPTPREDLAAITFLGAQIVDKHPIVKDWNVGSPSKIDLEKVTVSKGSYDSIHEITKQALYPVVEGYRDSWAVGMHGTWSDPIGLDRINVTVGYSPDNSLPRYERSHVDALWRHRGLRLGYKHNAANFYDLFGPTKVSRRGNSWLLGYQKPLIFDIPRALDLDLSIEAFNGLDTLPAFQNVAAPSRKLVTAAARLEYGYVINSLGKVDDEKGIRWNLNLETYTANGKTVPALYGGFDFGHPFLFDHSSLWLRTSAGLASGKASDPYANFFFGGFGNNYVDKGEVKRYRDHFSFPGFEINELFGRSYVRSILEWNLPPVRFSGIGTPANYLSWARPALFAGVLVTDPNDSVRRRTLQDLGVQVDFQFNVMHDQEMTLSVGSALGFENGKPGHSTEWMVSLKVLH
ncbi:MAG: hypothetical protein ABIQ97_01890 [Lysobacteraceae bacterium]